MRSVSRALALGVSLVSLVSLAGLAGCAGTHVRDEAPDLMRDPSFQPPGQGDLEVADAPEPPAKPAKAKTPRLLEKPNRHQNGTLRVATDVKR